LSSPEFSLKAVFDSTELSEYFEGFSMNIASAVLLAFRAFAFSVDSALF
jgi:hypothetical protein